MIYDSKNAGDFYPESPKTESKGVLYEDVEVFEKGVFLSGIRRKPVWRGGEEMRMALWKLELVDGLEPPT